ncbi:Acylphosphate phosphohydrolase (modular protein) [Tepidibacter aestuarii]|nr:Acylphosphate phosphohydrolase (modular protein) [Tepidibacter aestuarii]
MNGWVKNTSEGVYIDIEGKESNINKFIYNLKHKPPTLSKIDEIIIEDKKIINYKKFEIKHSDSVISKKFHNTVIDFSVKMCTIIAQNYNIHKVALSGGVFQNEILLKGIYEKLASEGFKVYTHKLIPCNDSGICVGQVVIANENSKE